MGKLKRCDILFSNPNGVFYSGQEVTGKVLVELSNSLKVRAVKLKFFGEASVSFNDNTKGKKSHSDKEKYFEQVDILFGNADSSLLGDNSQSLDEGIHEFPFVFRSPKHLPSSFESSNGYVRFWCKAYVKSPWKFDDTTKKAFTLISNVDLNLEPLAFTPGLAEVERKFSLTDRLMCCVRGGLSVQIRIPRSAFVPGEEILVNAEVNNMSTERVKRVEAFIQQNVIYSAKTGSRFDKGEQKISQITQGSVNSGEVQYWNNEVMVVPSLPPSKLGGCKYINVDYMLNFIVNVENAENILLTIPIVIGTIPLRTETTNHAPPITRTPSAPPVEDTGYIGPPPSYEECVYMDRGNIRDSDDNQDTGGESTYRPLYPIYATMPHFNNGTAHRGI